MEDTKVNFDGLASLPERLRSAHSGLLALTRIYLDALADSISVDSINQSLM